MTNGNDSNNQLSDPATGPDDAKDQRAPNSLKMHAIGRLAGGIAHDFNNILTTIQGNAELLQMGGFPPAECDEMLAQILDASRRATALNSQLLKFARKGTPELSAVDTNAIVDETAALLSHGIDKRIDIKLDMQADPSIVSANPWQLKSALVNLGMNACDAMPDGGVLHLRTKNIVLDNNPRSAGHDKVDDGWHVEICICGVASGKNGDTPPRTSNPCAGDGDANLASTFGCIQDLYGKIRTDNQPGHQREYRLLLRTAD